MTITIRSNAEVTGISCIYSDVPDEDEVLFVDIDNPGYAHRTTVEDMRQYVNECADKGKNPTVVVNGRLVDIAGATRLIVGTRAVTAAYTGEGPDGGATFLNYEGADEHKSFLDMLVDVLGRDEEIPEEEIPEDDTDIIPNEPEDVPTPTDDDDKGDDGDTYSIPGPNVYSNTTPDDKDKA